MDQDVTFMPGKKGSRLISAHVVIRIYAAYIPVLTLNRNDGDRESGKRFR